MLSIRDHKPSDLNFIFDSWMKSWRTSRWAGLIPNNMYYDVTRTIIEDLLARGSKLRVAFIAEYPDAIIGWACHEMKDGSPVLHYLHVKEPYLGLSFHVADTLIADLPGSHPGFITFNQQRKQTREWKHVPEMARRLAL